MARFEDVVTSFWDSSGCHGHVTQRPLTAEAMAEAEKLLGVTLPGELLELLRRQNGGVVADEWSAFPTDEATSWSPDHVPFEWLFGIGREARAPTLLDSPYLVAEWDLPSPVVLLCGDGPTWIGLDYRGRGPSGSPSVVWLDAEFRTELTLAAGFRSFVEGLMPTPDV